MQLKIDEKFYEFSKKLPKPLYIVGGYVRNFLIDGTVSEDIDVASELPVSEFLEFSKSFGYGVIAEYKRTGTAVIFDGKNKYEYSAFRSESYVNGKHTPEFTRFGVSVEEDALRRDFKCNAVYYDVKNEKFVDSLDGISDIYGKVLDTVKSAEDVFCSDGLRLMRLARFSAELNFTPKKEVVDGAKKFSNNITDISPERIYAELKRILYSDRKYPFSDKSGHYNGVKLLWETDVAKSVIPEAVNFEPLKYSDEKVRLACLFFGVSDDLLENRLKALKVDKNTARETLFLCGRFMRALFGNRGDTQLKDFVLENFGVMEKALLFLNAVQTAYPVYGEEYSDLKRTVEKVLSCKIPTKISDLEIDGKQLIAIGFSGKEVGKELKKLLADCQLHPKINSPERLKNIAVFDFEKSNKT